MKLSYFINIKNTIMKKLTLLFVLAAFLLAITGCAKIGNSEKVAEEFYEIVKAKTYNDIVPLLSNEALKASTQDTWLSVLKAKEGYWGGLISYEKTYSGVKTENGLTLTELRYTVENEKGKTYELLYFIEQDGEEMIYFYQYAATESELDGSSEIDTKVSEFAAQEAVCDKFYNVLKSHDFKNLQPLLSKEATDATPVNEWIRYVNDKEKSAGNLISYTLISSKLVNYETGNFITVKYKVIYDKMTLYEMFQFAEKIESTKIQYYAYNSKESELN